MATPATLAGFVLDQAFLRANPAPPADRHWRGPTGVAERGRPVGAQTTRGVGINHWDPRQSL